MKNALFLLFSLPVWLSAQNFSGSWGYEIDGNQINLYGDKIENQNNGGRSGTLKIAIYATDYPYSGDYLNGYLLSEHQLEPLDAGYYYQDISKVGWCTYPPEGSYSLTIILLEYISYDYQIVDYITMNGYTRF
ncbi:hypothetical protein OAA78_00450 [Flavobacteriaceae bacterium]|nr:hypothetical protein [Flavobacteriaceae bacterium]MDC1492878.1 hypothetical protein [Flavobacteriaceae bacterium]